LENEYTIHNSIVLAIIVPKIIKVGANLNEDLMKNNFGCFLDTMYTDTAPVDVHYQTEPNLSTFPKEINQR